jgi:periplasmic divalent cation tolerance protein
MNKLIIVTTTIGSLEEAQKLARTLVGQKLVACAQISAIESFYHWQDAVQHDKEFRVVLKTTDACYPALEAAIRALHPYELPAIFAVALEHVYAPYGDWVEANCCPPT